MVVSGFYATIGYSVFQCAGMRRETMMGVIFEDKFLCGKPCMVENSSENSSLLIASSQCYGRS